MTPAEILADPHFLPFRLDAVGRRLLFVRLDATQRADASFLDERIVGNDAAGAWLPLELIGGTDPIATPHAAPHFIFHIGHCGSTLLSRLLQSWPQVQSLREPLPLRTLAEIQSSLGSASALFSHAQWDALLRTLIGLWSRPLQANDATVIKATSSCNGLAAPLIAASPQSRALLLDMPLETCLAALLKSADSVRDAASAAPQRLDYLLSQIDDPTIRLHALSLPQQCAMGWVAEQLRFQSLCRDSTRFLRVSFDFLLQQPRDCLERIARHFDWDTQQVTHALASPAWGRYSKAIDHGYGAADRLGDLDESRRRHGAQIREGLAWVEHLQQRHSILATLPG